jgi:hypothetical protein
MSITSAKTGSTSLSLALENNFMEPIASTLVGAGGVNSIIFNDIPQGYKHLQVRLIGRTNRSNASIDQINMRFNSDTGSNYVTNHYIQGNGSAVYVGANTSGTLMTIYRLTADGSPALSNTFGVIIMDILDYANINKYKTIRALGGHDMNTVSGEVFFTSAAWMSTTPVSSITITPNTGSLFNQYSRFSLYGIKG